MTTKVRVVKAMVFLIAMYRCEKSESRSVVSDSLRLHGLYTVHEILQARILECVALLSSREFPGEDPNTGIKPRSPVLQADSLPAEPQGKPKNTGVGSLSLLQWIFLTQESNLHCRQILYQLSYQGRPTDMKVGS